MDSILTSTKRILNVAENDTSFDLDIITHINSAFSTLTQLGIGPDAGFFIEDNTQEWGEFGLPANALNTLKTYVVLKVRMWWDPPATSYHTNALKEEIKELEFRLNWYHEVEVGPAFEPEDFILDGGSP